MAPCRFFAAGFCFHGISCRNSHIFAPPDSTVPQSDPYETTMQQSPLQASTYNSTLQKAPCRFFSQGKCRYGAACKNSHDMRPAGGEPPMLPENSTPNTILSLEGRKEVPKIAPAEETLEDQESLERNAHSWYEPTATREQSQKSIPCIYFARGS
jgi:hypothetical protein